MTRLASWCRKGAQMATAKEYADCRVESVDGCRVVGWRCPLCSRIVRIGVSQSTNSDRGGWHGTLGPMWPRHYDWAQ